MMIDAERYGAGPWVYRADFTLDGSLAVWPLLYRRFYPSGLIEQADSFLKKNLAE